ncbi:hypothetical protein [Arthrobacter sp. G119Y2]|uniref:hypothetical protein n=1 Tax=Arthrobacter sp. G119Y2 TaxID=3134965 RepID=UPI003119E40A
MKHQNRLLRARLAVAVVVVLSLSSCTTGGDTGPAAEKSSAPETSAPAVGPVAAAFAPAGQVIGGDKAVMPGRANSGQCAVAANLRTLCHNTGGGGGSSLTFDGIHGFDQYRDSESLAANPPSPVQGLPAEAVIVFAEPTAMGFVIVFSEGYSGPQTILHTDFNGAEIWSTAAPSPVLDLAVTDKTILVSTDDGVKEMLPATGKSRDAAPTGTTLLGYKHHLSGYATYLPDQRGLALDDGGRQADPRPLVAGFAASCDDGEGCQEATILLADQDRSLISVSAPVGGGGESLTAYNADGEPVWTFDGAVNSAVRFEDTYVLALDAGAYSPAQLKAVNAATGSVIGEHVFDSDEATILGAVDAGVLVRYALKLPGSFDAYETVIPLEVTQGELPRQTAAATVSPSPADASPSATPSEPSDEETTPSAGDSNRGWSVYEGEDDPFRVDLPPGWSVDFEPGDGAPLGNRYIFRDATGLESAALSTNMSGLGGMCGGNPPWPVAERKAALPYLNRSALPVGRESPYLETEEGTERTTLTVTDLLTHPEVCPMYKLSQPGGGLGTMYFRGQLTTMEKGRTKEVELRQMMLSFRVGS